MSILFSIWIYSYWIVIRKSCIIRAERFENYYNILLCASNAIEYFISHFCEPDDNKLEKIIITNFYLNDTIHEETYENMEIFKLYKYMS